jgi:hypothetical protein
VNIFPHPNYLMQSGCSKGVGSRELDWCWPFSWEKLFPGEKDARSLDRLFRIFSIIHSTNQWVSK